jgi:hypothetical protein
LTCEDETKRIEDQPGRPGPSANLVHSLQGGVFATNCPPKTAFALEVRHLTDLSEERERLA